ncbi:hypothetical protein [Rhizobium sp.]|uniref:hypothetical protein n=1 Tax=Rhizobium sp. TaxID=391 RepID=UPI0028ADBCB4
MENLHPYSLQASILRYRGEVALHSAMCIEAAERGQDDNLPITFRKSMEVLESWDRPAADIVEAVMALELAVEDYEMGDTDRIPSMMKAALGWISAEQKRRASK